ncbi:hypothetical protein [Nonomuraea sp. NPDC050643]|uniref:hypothetical protein n=1 Tax=Nonomuraea sp. NPDC050643 TaxID=3155660 RepID=UPI0033C19553
MAAFRTAFFLTIGVALAGAAAVTVQQPAEMTPRSLMAADQDVPVTTHDVTWGG